MGKWFIGYVNAAYGVSALGLGFGLLAMALSSAQQPREALCCLILAGLCDLTDGLIARRLKLSVPEQAFGIQIDSLVDVVCFGLAPVVMAYHHPGGRSGLGMVVLVIYLLCVVHRLAYFNITGLSETASGKCYTGLPVTYIALGAPLAYLLWPAPAHDIWLPLLAGYALFYVVRIPIPKPGTRVYPVFFILAVGCIVLLRAP